MYLRNLLFVAPLRYDRLIHLKHLDDIRSGGMLKFAYPVWTIRLLGESAWSTAQIGIDPSGLKAILYGIRLVWLFQQY